MERKVSLENGEVYHIYNRGVDKRVTFLDPEDSDRFLEILDKFNTSQNTGSLYRSKDSSGGPILVDVISFCLNPNHFHLIIRQNIDGGISKFMQKIGTGYTNYFNKKYKRSGSLFQGTFKSKHIDKDDYLIHLSVYVNLNYLVHKIDSRYKKIIRSSWDQLVGDRILLPKLDSKTILDYFGSDNEYRYFAENEIGKIIENRELLKTLEEDEE